MTLPLLFLKLHIIEFVCNPPLEIINAEPRKELDDTHTFLHVGGDSCIKGFHILLKAVKALGKQGARLTYFC
jgi:hypothetical protein